MGLMIAQILFIVVFLSLPLFVLAGVASLVLRPVIRGQESKTFASRANRADDLPGTA